jgi:hypothetical protein
MVQRYSDHVSYDLQLFRPLPGETTEAALVRLDAAARSDEPDPGPIVSEVEEGKRRLAEALMRHTRSLRQFDFDYRRITNLMNVDEAEARRKCRHIELNEDRWGLQIKLMDETASATLGYWHEGHEAQTAFRILWECLVVLQKEAGYLVYDPQLGRVLSLTSEHDFSDLLERYLSVKHTAGRAIRGNVKQRPWWKFW